MRGMYAVGSHDHPYYPSLMGVEEGAAMVGVSSEHLLVLIRKGIVRAEQRAPSWPFLLDRDDLQVDMAVHRRKSGRPSRRREESRA